MANPGNDGFVGDPIQHGGNLAKARALLDSRMTKRALRARLGMSSDAHLAVVLGLPAADVAAWPEEGSVPAIPQVLKLLGAQEAPAAPSEPEDPDADRIVTVEAA